jgi:hypothetical protein
VIEIFEKGAHEQKSIFESDWGGGAVADFAATPFREHECPAMPSFRSSVAIGFGVEATRRGSRREFDSG